MGASIAVTVFNLGVGAVSKIPAENLPTAADVYMDMVVFNILVLGANTLVIGLLACKMLLIFLTNIIIFCLLLSKTTQIYPFSTWVTLYETYMKWKWNDLRQSPCQTRGRHLTAYLHRCEMLWRLRRVHTSSQHKVRYFPNVHDGFYYFVLLFIHEIVDWSMRKYATEWSHCTKNVERKFNGGYQKE